MDAELRRLERLCREAPDDRARTQAYAEARVRAGNSAHRLGRQEEALT